MQAAPSFAGEGLSLYTQDYYDLLWQSYELYQSQNKTALPKTKEYLKIEADTKLDEWFHDAEIDPLILEKLGIAKDDTKKLTLQDFAKKAKQTLQSMPHRKEKTALSDKLRRFAHDIVEKHHDYKADAGTAYHLLFSGKGNCVARNTLYAAMLNTMGIRAIAAVTNVDKPSDHLTCVVESSRLNPETNKYEEKYEISEIVNPFQGIPHYLVLQVPLASGEIKEVQAAELTKFQSQREKEYEINFGNITYAMAIGYYVRGTAYYKSEEYRKAVEDCNEAIKLNPNYATAYSLRGAAYYKLGEYRKTIEDCTKAIELNPKLAEAYNNRGAAHDYLGEYLKGVEDYTIAIELNPNNAGVYNNRGVAYASMKDYAKAMENFNKAISLGNNLAWWNKLRYTIKRYTWDIIIAPFEVAYNFIAGLFSKGAEVKQVAQTDNRLPRNTAVTSAPADPKVKWYRDPILYR